MTGAEQPQTAPQPLDVMELAKVSEWAATTGDGYGRHFPLPAREIAQNMLTALSVAGFEVVPVSPEADSARTPRSTEYDGPADLGPDGEPMEMGG